MVLATTLDHTQAEDKFISVTFIAKGDISAREVNDFREINFTAHWRKYGQDVPTSDWTASQMCARREFRT